MRQGVRITVLGILGLVLVPAGMAVGETQVPDANVNASQEATVSVHQQDGERLDTHIEVTSGPDGDGFQQVTVNSVQERTVSEVSGGAGIAGTPGGTAARPLVEEPILAPSEEAQLQETRPASGETGTSREREIRIAREQIYARPVGNVSKDQYKALYKSAAARYGFEEDWYVLAAVGWIESHHGENMGPSSSGAMGPMQFLPSTWRSSGVDGNRDGVRNIMDPEDAIPAAARYLKRGGAPDDWTAALYTYNHSDAYVRDVLESAERYRKLAKDSRVGPYTPDSAVQSSR